MHYSAKSTVLPTNAPDLLNWAAAHIQVRGFHDGRDGKRFGYDGSTTTTALLRPGMLGALDVAGGDGRQSSARRYDYDALYAARRLALDALADLAAGGAVLHDRLRVDEYKHRRFIVHEWGMKGGRTGAEAAALFREAALYAEHAAVAATRPGRPPRRIRPASVAAVLEWAARHLEDVGHSADHFTHGPGYVESAPCTMLHALDRALVAAKPYPSDGPEAWDAYREAAPTALRLVAEHVAGRPVNARNDYDTKALQRAVVLAWGNKSGVTTARVVAAFRAAVPAVEDAGAIEDEVPAEPGQVAFF
ncbi:DUF6197 family protein [Streptomyces nogalater]|uniref:DUF6197 family protein n=1 Tax=Streptomyces nogalater TaxID=38314 RepID=A0ABW0W8P7_STRNO